MTDESAITLTGAPFYGDERDWLRYRKALLRFAGKIDAVEIARATADTLDGEAQRFGGIRTDHALYLRLRSGAWVLLSQPYPSNAEAMDPDVPSGMGWVLFGLAAYGLGTVAVVIGRDRDLSEALSAYRKHAPHSPMFDLPIQGGEEGSDE